jgi:predicted esterase
VTHGHLEVRRTARFFSLGAEAARAQELWIVLHGHGQLAERFLAWFAVLHDGATHVVAPEALSRFYLGTGTDGRHLEQIGATWLTREDREADLQDHLRYLDDLLRYLLAQCPASPRITVLGFSQGSVMAARWLATGPAGMSRVLLWGTPMPDDVDPAILARRQQGASLRLVAGDSDRYAPAAILERQATTLRQHGLDAALLPFPGGHTIPEEVLLQVAGRRVAG